jgi:hypothetical protein
MKHGRMTGETAAQEMRVMQEARNAEAVKLIESWSKTDVGVGLEDLYGSHPGRARRTAIAIQMQEQHLKQLSETIISTEFNLKPEHVLKVVRIGTANSNRGEMFTEYPMMTTDDAFYYINMTYDKSLRGATAGEKMYENVYPYYAGEQQTAELDANAGGGAAFSGTLSPASCVPFTFQIIVGGAIVAQDDGAGNVVGTALDSASANTINYDTGAWVLNFLSAVPAGTPINCQFSWNSEDSSFFDQYGKMGIGLEKVRLNARPQPLGYSYSVMTELVLGTTGLGDAEAMLLGAVGDEHAKSRDYKAIALAKRVAMGNAIAEFDCDFASQGEISANEHAQNILGKIESVGGSIYDDIKRGQVNRAIAGSQALVYLKKHRLWRDDTSQGRVGVYKAGMLSDIDVYCCPADSALVGSDDMLLTFKNPQEGLDVSIVFGVLTEIAASLKYPQFYVDGNVASVEDARVINGKFVRLLQLKNLSL